MDPIRALGEAVRGHLDAIRTTAMSSPPGGGPAWDALLVQYGLRPFDASERATAVSRFRLSRGAAPGEVRMAFDGLARWASSECARLAQDPALARSPTLEELRGRLATLVEGEIAAYERAIGVPTSTPQRPTEPRPHTPAAIAPSLASIFANAQTTSKNMPVDGTYKYVATLECGHCGGPQETPQDFMCRYCRRPIAGAIKPTS